MSGCKTEAIIESKLVSQNGKGCSYIACSDIRAWCSKGEGALCPRPEARSVKRRLSFKFVPPSEGYVSLSRRFASAVHAKYPRRLWRWKEPCQCQMPCTRLTCPGARMTHHSKAAKTVATCAHLHTLPLQDRWSATKTAWAMKPANQKSIVMASSAKMAYGCAARGKKRGARIRKGTTTMTVQIPLKIRKLTRSGEE